MSDTSTVALTSSAFTALTTTETKALIETVGPGAVLVCVAASLPAVDAAAHRVTRSSPLSFDALDSGDIIYARAESMPVSIIMAKGGA